MYLEVFALATFGCLLIVLLLLFVRWKISFGVLSKYGIRGPPPELYYGNTRQIAEKGLPQFLDINLKKHGSIYCYFVGLQPTIVVSDLEILKEIMVKQFDSFMDRSDSIRNALGVKTADDAETIVQSRGNKWRRQRKILSKAFSTGKLKMMGPLIEESCTLLVSKLEQFAKEKQSFDIWNIYGLFTLNVILKVGFGHNIDLLNGEEDEFADAVGAVLSFAKHGSPARIFTLCSNFPFMGKIIAKLISRSELGKKSDYVLEKVTEIIQARQQDDTGNYQDLLQLLIDAKADSDDEDIEETSAGKMAYKYKLTEGEILQNSNLFIGAGYETTQNTLSYASYLLALHPDKQEKLLEEIDEYYNENPDASLLEASQSIKYVDMVIHESLRVYPPAPILQRKVVRTTVINGHTFPKGCNVLFPAMSMYHSPDIWPEPTEFKPERFTSEEKEKRNPMAHMPFGYGPRQCIAMRLALMEAKMALVAVLKEYRFVETPDTEKPLKTVHGITLSPKHGIYLSVQKR